MIKNIILLLLFIACSCLSYAQVSYIGKGKIHLKDGSVVDGTIKFKPAYSKEIDLLIDSAAKKWKTYNTSEAASFELDTLLFEPRIPKGGEVAINPGLEFMEIVVKSKTGLNMYIEHYQEKVQFMKNIPLKNSEKLTLYVSVPGNAEEAYDLNSFKFIPKFDDKVSKMLEACPALAEKVSTKQKGYFYNLMNQQKAPDIWSTIILEYKKCVDK